IQIDREEWLNATATFRRALFFWRGKPRPVEADESLNALLARRDQVRSTQTRPAVQPAAELFQPARAVDVTSAAVLTEREAAAPQTDEPAEQGSKKSEAPAGTTSRLLEAKRRAQKRRE
ncbi:MAG TPA: hypothetical protein VGF13_08885, partial [Verrucomicrobiae bacterium]